jgi:hypothetical protein
MCVDRRRRAINSFHRTLNELQSTSRKRPKLPRVQQGASRTRRRSRSELSTLQGMAHSTEFPDPDGAQAATINGNFLVRCDLQGASLHLTTTERGMQLTDVVTKWRALFNIRSRTHGDRSGSLTAE